MRSKKALANIIASMVLQVTATICGLIVLKLTIETFGSAVNGLVASIEQFLGFVILLDTGVGGVVRSALYKPLAGKDIYAISRITRAAEKFYRTIAFISVGYVIVLAILYPYLVSSSFDRLFTFSLILIIGITSFFRYYFGISYRLLLYADQRKYVDTSFQVVGIIVSTVIVLILINFGASIQIVTLGSSLIYIIRPIILNYYVKRKYQLDMDCPADKIAIDQKWDAFGHHLAGLVHRKTDVVVLTVFTPIVEVSVYAVYSSVIAAVKILLSTFFSNLEAAFGDMIAKGERKLLEKNFRVFEFLTFSLTTILFTCTALLIMPFVSVYTSGITDANYLRPAFAYTLIIAEAFSCVRIPYQTVALAAGHFRQTRNGAFVEAGLNVALSVLLVYSYGMVGVAVGTLCAMLFRTVQYVVYLSNNILERSAGHFVKRFIIYTVTSLVIVSVVKFLPLIPSFEINSYLSWVVYAVAVTLTSAAITFFSGMLFYRDDVKDLAAVIKRMLSRKQRIGETP